jgi:hypothetical protein
MMSLEADKFSMVLGTTGICSGKPWSVCQPSGRPWFVPMSWHPRHNLPDILDFLVSMSWNPRHNLAVISDVRRAVQAPSRHI